MSLLTQGSLLKWAGVTDEQFRTWKRVLPPLQGRRGREERYSLGDLLALRTISRLLASGISVGKLASVATAIFGECQEDNWAKLEHQCVIIRAQDGYVVTANKASQVSCLSVCGAFVLDIGKEVTDLKRDLKMAPPESTDSAASILGDSNSVIHRPP